MNSENNVFFALRRLPYTEATIRETLRYETLTPLGVIHRCTKDTMFQGYFIPNNTIMITNINEINNDPDFWGDPENFRPERFLKDNGQLNKDFSIPFSAGKSDFFLSHLFVIYTCKSFIYVFK